MLDKMKTVFNSRTSKGDAILYPWKNPLPMRSKWVHNNMIKNLIDNIKNFLYTKKGHRKRRIMLRFATKKEKKNNLKTISENSISMMVYEELTVNH